MTRRAATILGAGLLISIVLTGCLTRPQTAVFYYTLDYLSETEEGALRQDEAHPSRVQVLDTRVVQAYSRPQLVQRGIGPGFVYLPDHLWGIDLSETVADLIERRARSYRVFEYTTREFTREEPDFEIRSTISALEYVVFGGLQFATVDFELALVANPSESVAVRHIGRVEAPVPAEDASVYVAEVNRLVMREIDRFLAKVITYLATGEQVVDEQLAAVAGAEADDTSIGGSGELLLPRLGQSENQPYFTVRSLDGEIGRSGQFGVPLLLPAGRYSVTFGSGPTDLQMRRGNVEVAPRRLTVVEATWSSMTVSVVDTTRRPVRLRFDVYDGETGESYGGLVSSSETLVSAQRVWILPPGRYKIVINSRPFATLEDFVTVNLIAGRSEELTLVVGPDENGAATVLRGGGNIDIEDVGDSTSPLSASSAVNASLSFAMDDEGAPWDFSTLVILDSEVESELTYEIRPLRYELRSLVALGLSAADRAPLRVTSDRFRLRNTLLYGLTPVYSLYTRLDTDAALFGNRLISDEPQNYVKREDEQIVEQEQDAQIVRLSPAFFPLTLREGAGLSITAVRTPRFDLGLRGGLGATQTVRYRTYELVGSVEIDGETYSAYDAVGTSSDIGLEFSAFATVIPPWNTSLTSSMELFVPFSPDGTPSFDWENSISVILANNVSLLYRFSLRTEGQGSESRLIQDHGVFVRLNYLLR